MVCFGASFVCSALPQSVAEWGSVAIGARSGRSEVAVTLWGSGNCDAIRGGAAIGAAIGDCPAPAAAGTKAPAIDSLAGGARAKSKSAPIITMHPSARAETLRFQP